MWAGEQPVQIEGYGNVDIQIQGLQQQQQSLLLRLRDVAYCPGFACNLVSLRQLQKGGLWWDNSPGNNCIRRYNGSFLYQLMDRYGQYILEDLPPTYSNATFFTRRNKFNTYTEKRPNKALANLWHLRLGHPGPQALEQLVHNTKGVRIKGPTTVECDACGISKAKRQINRKPRDHSEGPGLRLALDFHDFNQGYSSYKYLLLVTDRWSGLAWDYYLKDRTTGSIITAISYLLGSLQQQYQLKPKVVECDNELIKPVFKGFFD